MDSGPETPAQYRYGAVEKKIGCCITQTQLNGFIDKYTLRGGSHGSWILKKMRARLPGAIQLVYDNYNALAIGFGPSERSSEAIFSIVLYPRYVTLFFCREKMCLTQICCSRAAGKLFAPSDWRALPIWISRPLNN